MARRIRSPGKSRPNSHLIIAVASIAVCLALLLGRSYQLGQPSVRSEPVIVPAFETLNLPVPSEPVAVGRRLRDVQWTTMEYPRHLLREGVITDNSRYLESIAAVPLPAHLPVFEENIATEGQAMNPVVEKIPTGMRAMTIKVDATIAVEGWAGSGSLVDVLLIGRERTTVVAEKVKILSAERSVSPVERDRVPSIPSTVTLLVSQEQCLAINTAIPLGRIAFALRSVNDDSRWTDPVYTADRLKNLESGPAVQHAITGYLAVKGNPEKKAFALTDGRWIETSTRPPGFFANRSEEGQ